MFMLFSAKKSHWLKQETDHFELAVKKGSPNLFLGLILALRHIMCIIKTESFKH